MMDYIKKLSVSGWLLAVGACLAVLGLIVALISCSGEGFGMAEMPLIALLSIASVALFVGIVFVSASKGDGVITSVMVMAMVLALTFCVYFMIIGKSDVFGTVLFSDLEKGYAPAESAAWLGVVSIVMYIVATLAAAVGAFGSISKNR